MRPTRSALLAAALSAALLASAAGCDSASEPESKGDILIAADLELSGAAAAVGTAYERALRLKVEQINVSGVLGGRRIKLDVRDNRSDKTLSTSNISEFTSNSAVAAIITGVCGDCIVAAVKTANDAKVPTISLAPVNAATTPLNERQYIFKVGANPADDAALIAGELRDTGAKRVAVLTTDDAYGQDGQAAMRGELDGDETAKIVSTRQFKTTDTDVSQVVRTALEDDPDSLVVWAFADQAQRVAAAARAAGYRGPIYFDAAAAGELFMQQAPQNTTLVFTQTMAIDDVIATNPAKAARKQWFGDYTSRYGSYFGPASFAADALQLLADAMNQSGGTDREAVRDALESIKVDGLSGPLRITPDNHSALMPQALVALEANSGRWRLRV
ncbi:ABC transporter substrate-binding protein [Micromonospora sp. CPCC 206061]|uniref:ABC transporter substrate-binding protein n=1 Tax=Micromonospora sp. CPCC 206061 TaxID=3122410 RepID=UPI002FF3EC6A